MTQPADSHIRIIRRKETCNLGGWHRILCTVPGGCTTTYRCTNQITCYLGQKTQKGYAWPNRVNYTRVIKRTFAKRPAVCSGVPSLKQLSMARAKRLSPARRTLCIPRELEDYLHSPIPFQTCSRCSNLCIPFTYVVALQLDYLWYPESKRSIGIVNDLPTPAHSCTFAYCSLECASSFRSEALPDVLRTFDTCFDAAMQVFKKEYDVIEVE